jgi:hypothetical protein
MRPPDQVEKHFLIQSKIGLTLIHLFFQVAHNGLAFCCAGIKAEEPPSRQKPVKSTKVSNAHQTRIAKSFC